jgi:hypothetical protein
MSEIVKIENLKFGDFEININEQLTVVSVKKFSEIYLWDSKGNCRGRDVSGISELNGKFLHTFDEKLHTVDTNITDRRYMIEFLNPGQSHDIYKIDRDKFNQIKEPFLNDFEKQNPK